LSNLKAKWEFGVRNVVLMLIVIQCDDAATHCMDYKEDSFIAKISSSQHEYFTHWEIVMFYAKKVIWINEIEPMMF
jgi:hypothetical protein